MTNTGAKVDRQPRGDGWVAGQFALFGLVAAAAFFGPEWPWHRATLLTGTIVAILGASLFASGIGALGNALTPFPRPRGQLVVRGPFGLVRHPIYGGVVLELLAVSLLTRPLALVPALFGIVFLTLKARHEEQLLREAVPGYDAYCRRVHRRFIPFVL